MDRPAAIAAQNFFSFVNSEFYEPPSKYNSSNIFKDKVQTLVPESWHVFRSDVWLHVQDPSRSEIRQLTQGFKIHVSCAPQYALELLETIIPVFVEHNVNFKTACDDKILHLLNSKLQPRGYAGKFITVYPPDLQTFKTVIETLYQKTKHKNYKGPYILSDKRYKESKILYYRYGGFYPPSKLNIDGTQSSFLIAPDGAYVSDQRLPYFQLPEWKEDPFLAAFQVDDEETEPLLKNRYLIEGAFGFSNAGGVYYGTDTFTDKPIIVKEARPHTNCWKVNEQYWDAVHLLKREHKILEHLHELEFIPQVLDFFREGEHSFFVAEKVDGVRLDSFWALDDKILAPYIRREGNIDHFISKFIQISKVLIYMVEEIHKKGILIGDLSSRNILINQETFEAWMIDFESSVFKDDDENMLTYATRWGTNGFINPDRKNRNHLLPIDDFYSLGMILYSAVVPANSLFNLKPAAKDLFIEEFTKLGLPPQIKNVIIHLLQGESKAASKIVNNWTWKKNNPLPKLDHQSLSLKEDKASLEKASEQIADYILQSADYKRNDRLWPAHYSVYLSNPLSVSYGACGILLFLIQSKKEIPVAIKEWMFKQKLNNESYPPGLFLGLAGIAYTYHQAGYLKEAEAIMDQLYQSPLLLKEPSIFLGAAGWGMISLYFYIETKDSKHLEYAIKAGEYLLETAEEKNGNYYWPSDYDGKTHYGYGYGASGLGLFLLYLYVASQRKEFLNYAIKGLAFDLEEKIDSEVGLQWKRFEGDTLLYPYFIHGSAGIGSVLLRFYHILGDKKYKALAYKIVEDSYIKYSFIPSQFEGLAGIGELMIDAYHYSKDEKYHHYANDIAQTILWFGIDKKDKGMAYPGRWLTRISNDFGTGSAGIGLFLQRVLNHSPRHFMDLDIEKLKQLV